MAVNFALKIAEGVTAKLHFDFACVRGHSFGEYHIHGVVNEIVSANIDPSKQRVHTGYAHYLLQQNGNPGRKRELDFALENLSLGVAELYAEVKWAGSSHCTPSSILIDLIRLQLIKNNEPIATCLFILSGNNNSIGELFRKSFLQAGNGSLLLRVGDNGLQRRTTRIKYFSLNNNSYYQNDIDRVNASQRASGYTIPDKIVTRLSNSSRSASDDGRFSTLVWIIQKNR